MNSIIILYYCSYLLTLSGFILGKITTYEHHEIKQKALIIAKLFIITTLGLMVIITLDSYFLLIAILSILLFFLNEFKIKNNKEIIYGILFATSFFIFSKFNYYQYIPLLLFALVINNSFRKINLAYESLLLLIISILLFLIIIIF